MNKVLHKADTRGFADHGWLKSYHSFSFASYFNSERMNFGVLRVLNDDFVAAGMGFGTHPHDNMEIVSIPLEGKLKHKDSMNNEAYIQSGEIQVMSAGTGVSHSEYNDSAKDPVKFLQIWIIPDKRDVTPRYDQISYDMKNLKNEFYQILSPNPDDEGVWIHQQAWFYLSDLEKDVSRTYQWKKEGNGLYVFVLDGEIAIADEFLGKRDALGIWDANEVEIASKKDSKLLLMEVPLQY